MSNITKVVVYGSLLSGLGNHGVMVNACGKLIDTGVSVENFDMYSLGGFPSVSLKHNEHESPLVVEVYDVEDKNLHIIDRLEGYNLDSDDNFYNRSPIKVKLDTTGEVVEGLIYHIDEQKRTPVPSGNWREYLNQVRYGY